MGDKICVVSEGVDATHLRQIVKSIRAQRVVLNSYKDVSLVEEALSESKVELENFVWNENGSVDEFRVASYAFDISDNAKHFNYYSKIFSLLGVDFDDELGQKISKKIYTERAACILTSLFLSKNYIADNNKVYLVLSREDEWLFAHIKDTLAQGKVASHELREMAERVTPVYVGYVFSVFFKAYVYSVGLFLRNIFSIRRIGAPVRKLYKVGVMVWGGALPARGPVINGGIDWLLGGGVSKKDTVFYLEDKPSRSYIRQLKKFEYNYIDYSLSNVYRSCDYTNVVSLFRALVVITFLFPFLVWKTPLSLIVRLPYTLYNYYRWNKFLEEYYFKISLSYNDYSLSCLIKNYIFMKNNVKPWSYAHSCSDKYVFDVRSGTKDSAQSYISYDRRYYLLPGQVDFFLASRIEANDVCIMGPLFSRYIKDKVYVDEKYMKKINGKKVVSIFLASVGSKAINSKESHSTFIRDINKLVRMLDDDVVFFLKGKGNYVETLNAYSDGAGELVLDIVDSQRVFFISDEIYTSQLLGMSNFVISMSFTSPTIEGLAAGVPSVFYDPCALFPGSGFRDIENLYFSSFDELSHFCLEVLDGNKLKVDQWVQVARKGIGITSNRGGVDVICSDIYDEINEAVE